MVQLAFVAPGRGPGAPPGLLESVAAAMKTTTRAGGHSLRVLSSHDEDLEAVLAGCDLPIYEIANDPRSYQHVYELALRHPGVVVLVDTDIGRLVASLIEEGNELGEQAVKEARTAVSQVLAESRDWDRSDPLPWCARVVRRARAVVVAQPSDADYLRRFRCRTPIHVMPFPRQPGHGRANGGEPGTMPDGGSQASSLEEFARGLGQAVEQTIELLNDPVRKALEGWASALADCGGSVDGFRAGYGARYADALESLSTPTRSPKFPILPGRLSARWRARRGAGRER